jgi:cell division protein FtsI/penicillin-binding protein 2
MLAWQRWLGVGVAAGVIYALVPEASTPLPEEPALQAPLGKLSEAPPPPAPEPDVPNLSGLNLLQLELEADRVTSPLPDGRTAELTLEPGLQRATLSIMRRYALPEAGAVLMDVKSGELLVYASQVREGEPFDVNLRAEAPAASIFKIVTAASLLETPSINGRTEQCYRGGGQSRIRAADLVEDPKRDQVCATLGNALGRSLNIVFGRMAQRYLTPRGLTQTAQAFGFGAPTPFDVPSEAPGIELPADPLEFARAAAGFWHSTLSPLAAASIAQTVALGGLTLRPRIVSAIHAGEQTTWQASAEPVRLRRALPESRALELNKMMRETVTTGSASRSFRDPRGRPYLGDVRVAGKTGTLSRAEQNRYYTWFVGFAPADQPRVAVATLVVNTPIWRLKAPQLARDVLRAYFAEQKTPGVTAP